jgi:quercetin dioxygenase-like cupin family protein
MDSKHHFSDSLYAKECFIPAGSLIVQHKHTYDHLSIVAQGTVRVLIDDEVKEFTAPYCINIEKDKNHSVLAVTDCVWYCIHGTSETDETKIDEVLIKKEGV